MLLMDRAERGLVPILSRARDWWDDERAALAPSRSWGLLERALRAYGALLVIALAAVFGGLLQSLSPSADAEAFLQAAHQLLSGSWADVFADPFFQIGPLHLVIVSLGVVLSRLTGIPEYAASGAVQAALVAALALAAAKTTVPVGIRGCATKRAVLIAAVLLAGPLASAALHGHDEEIFVILLLLLASASPGQRTMAVLLVGVAGGIKLWGLLGLPLLFLGVGWLRGARRSAVAVGLVVASYLPFYVYGHVGTFDYVWRVASGAPISALVSVGDPYPWPLRLGQGLVATVLGLWFARTGRSGIEVLVAICSVRLLLDPNPFSYYGIALLLALQHVAARASAQPLTRQLLAAVAVPVGVMAPDLLRGVPALYAVTETCLLVGILVALQRPRHADNALPITPAQGVEPGRTAESKTSTQALAVVGR